MQAPSSPPSSSSPSSSLPWVIALTGGIGSGKSTVAKLLAEKGLPIIDADLLSREVVSPGSRGLSEVVEAFGSSVLNEDKTLNRSKLGKIIFGDKAKREKLESILHPKIRTLFRERLKELKPGPVIYVVPLYFESKEGIPEVKRVIVVYSGDALCADRIQRRDNISPEEAKKRVEIQLSIDDKRAKADYTIDNTGGLDALGLKVLEAFSWIISEYEREHE